MEGTAHLALSRRDLMLRILQTAPALGILTCSASAAQQQTAPWAPQFLSAGQNETLIALGERIVPGSAGAFCNRLIDLMMTIESEKNRKELLDALVAFDRQAQGRFQKPFRELPPSNQNEILAAASEPNGALYSQFGVVKEWTADAYWSSEKGLRELGWTGRLAWDSFPNCGSAQRHN